MDTDNKQGAAGPTPASDGSAAQRDISADARQWLDERSGIVQTHHYGCHMLKGHEACLVERLLGRLAWAERERDSLRVAIENLSAYTREIALTDEEWEAVDYFAVIHAVDGEPLCNHAVTLRDLLERRGRTQENEHDTGYE